MGEPAVEPVLLLLHIPKTAGTTLSKIAYWQFERDEEPEGSSERLHSGVFYYDKAVYPAGFFNRPGRSNPPDVVRAVLARPDLRAVIGHFFFGIDRLIEQPTRYLTLLREPVDRIVSLFYHLKKWGYQHLAEDPVYELYPRLHRDSTADLVALVTRFDLLEVDNDQTRRISGINPPYGKCTRGMLEQAKENLARSATTVGLTDRFNESVVLMKLQLGWRRELRYFPQLVNPARPSASEISPLAREAILERNRWDAELYDFAQSLFTRRLADWGSSFQSELSTFVAQQEANLAPHRHLIGS